MRDGSLSTCTYASIIKSEETILEEQTEAINLMVKDRSFHQIFQIMILLRENHRDAIIIMQQS